MLYAISASIEGATLMDVLKFETKSPFISLDKKFIGKDLVKTWDAFVDYMASMAESLEKLPALAENIVAIVAKTGTLADNASGELEGLGMMGKVKAAKSLAVNSKGLAGVPALATATTNKLKATLEDISETVNMLKNKGD
jgi:hypothetical protein